MTSLWTAVVEINISMDGNQCWNFIGIAVFNRPSLKWKWTRRFRIFLELFSLFRTKIHVSDTWNTSQILSQVLIHHFDAIWALIEHFLAKNKQKISKNRFQTSKSAQFTCKKHLFFASKFKSMYKYEFLSYDSNSKCAVFPWSKSMFFIPRTCP